MSWLVGKMKWIMLVSGLLTCTMVYAAVAPDAALVASFGAPLEGPAAQIVVRNWGALIALVGLMLVHGAFRPAVRPLVLTIASASKLIFIGLVLAYGRGFLSGQLGVSVAVDLVMVTLFVAYLAAERNESATA